MIGFRKRLLPVAVAAPLAFAAAAAGADDRVDDLMAELAAPDSQNWQGVESEILRVWAQSGSDAMDLLLRRGRDAIEAEEYAAAVEHLTALTDHAPDFAEGWNTRATAFYLMGEYALSIADIEKVLALNPRHFGALSGLAVMLDELGEPELALEAHRAVRDLNPHRADLNPTISRLESMVGGAEL